MRGRHFFVAVALCLAVGCTTNEGTHNVVSSEGRGPSARRTDAPVVIPPLGFDELAFRERNYGKEGSCGYATLCFLLKRQGQFADAERVRKNYGGGIVPGSAGSFEKCGIRYAETFDQSDIAFLEWACASGRGCGVSCSAWCEKCQKLHYCVHCIALVYLDDEIAVTIDPNGPEVKQIWPRDKFLEDWLRSKSWAFTPVYQPLPPEPIAWAGS